jgi:hypothetical protein
MRPAPRTPASISTRTPFTAAPLPPLSPPLWLALAPALPLLPLGLGVIEVGCMVTDSEAPEADAEIELKREENEERVSERLDPIEVELPPMTVSLKLVGTLSEATLLGLGVRLPIVVGSVVKEGTL